MYLLKLREYLEQRKTESVDFQDLSRQFQGIINQYAKVRNQRNSDMANDIEDLEADEKLQTAINKFLKKYKEVHRL